MANPHSRPDGPEMPADRKPLTTFGNGKADGSGGTSRFNKFIERSQKDQWAEKLASWRRWRERRLCNGAAAGGQPAAFVRAAQPSGFSVGLGVGPVWRRWPALRFATGLSSGEVEGCGAPAVFEAAGAAPASLSCPSRCGCGSPPGSGDFTAGLDVSFG